MHLHAKSLVSTRQGSYSCFVAREPGNETTYITSVNVHDSSNSCTEWLHVPTTSQQTCWELCACLVAITMVTGFSSLNIETHAVYWRKSMHGDHCVLDHCTWTNHGSSSSAYIMHVLTLHFFITFELYWNVWSGTLCLIYHRSVYCSDSVSVK